MIAPDTDQDAALDLAERGRAAIANTPVADVGRMTASVGVATLMEHENVRSVVQRADAALDVAKDDGRDAVASSRGTAV